VRSRARPRMKILLRQATKCWTPACLPSRTGELGAAYQFQKKGLRKSAIRFGIWIHWTQVEFASPPRRAAYCMAGHAHRTEATPVAAAHCNVCLAEEARGLATLVSSKRSRMPRQVACGLRMDCGSKEHAMNPCRWAAGDGLPLVGRQSRA